MKLTYLALAIVFSIVLISCKKSGINYRSMGVITGEDDRMCMTCGGYYISIDSNHYRFWSLPANSSINLNHAKYPIRILLNWHKDTSTKIPDIITVDAAQQIQ